MKKKLLKSMRVLLVAAGLCVGASVWAQTTYDFEESNPFTNDASVRLSMSLTDDATLNSKVVNFGRARSGYTAFGHFDFSGILVANATTVTIEFDYFIKQVAGHDVISISSAGVHTLSGGGWSDGSNTGYGATGTIFNLGCFRSGSGSSATNYFGVNSAQDATLAATPLGIWSHAVIVVNNSTRTVNYTLTKKSDASVIKSANDVAFLNASATTCTQIDVYIGQTTVETGDIMIDNLTISSEADASTHNYTINAVCGGETIKKLAEGMCTEGSDFSTVINQVVKDGSGNYYTLDAGQTGITNYTATYTMGAADVVKEITYTLDATIEYFSEGENFYGSQKNAGDTYSGGYATGYMANTANSTGTLSGGTYEMDVYVTGRFGSNPLNVYDATGTYELATTGKGNSTFTGIKTTGRFKAAASSSVRVGLKGGNSLAFDYFIIRKVNNDATVTKTITVAGWATYCSPYNLDFSSDIDNLDAAYIVTGGASGVLTKTEVTGTVPAGTGLLLKGNGECVIPVAASSTFDVTENKLEGKTAEYALAAEGGYVLMNDATNGLGFYLNSNAFTVGANTAYLPAGFDGSSARPAFFWFGDATGINAVQATETASKNYYNLSGQRVTQPTKGLYIVNGKKVIIK